MSAREVWLINVLMKHDDELLRQINAEADRMCSLPWTVEESEERFIACRVSATLAIKDSCAPFKLAGSLTLVRDDP